MTESATMKRFRQWMFDQYHLNPHTIYCYFRDYMASQLQRHRRRRDGRRRMQRARQLNSVTPVVKLTIDGLYLGLSGILLLEEQKISGDIQKLHQRYAHHFEEGTNGFIRFCIDHKLNRTPPGMSTRRWIELAMKKRDDLFDTLLGRINEARENTPLEWSDAHWVENKVGLENRLLREFYGGARHGSAG